MLKLRNLVALLIICAMLPLSLSILDFCVKLDFDYRELQDDIALYQLRRILLLSYDHDYSPDSLSFTYQGRRFSLSPLYGNLVLSEGYQIFVSDADYYEFRREGNVLILEYERKGKTYEKVLGEYEGLRIDSFSASDDELPECDECILSPSEGET